MKGHFCGARPKSQLFVEWASHLGCPQAEASDAPPTSLVKAACDQWSRQPAPAVVRVRPDILDPGPVWQRIVTTRPPLQQQQARPGDHFMTILRHEAQVQPTSQGVLNPDCEDGSHPGIGITPVSMVSQNLSVLWVDRTNARRHYPTRLSFPVRLAQVSALPKITSPSGMVIMPNTSRIPSSGSTPPSPIPA